VGIIVAEVSGVVVVVLVAVTVSLFIWRRFEYEYLLYSHYFVTLFN